MSNIDWSRLVTKAMKDAKLAAQTLAEARAELSSRNLAASSQIARVQDRIDTLGYGIESGEATIEDEEELTKLKASLPAWKTYKFQLGKVATQPTWPAAPKWPAAPPVPEIAADPAPTETA
jgi:ABC-type uncharacterized transport system YnjBCD substrate-binding protein